MMKPGTYYIGDLCYVMHDRWDEFCSLTIADGECLEGEFKLSDGKVFATYGTRYGDGGYFDQNGREYGVDAGLIGCILVSDIAPEELKNLDLGHVVEFDRSFRTGSDGSVLTFGHVSIDTDPPFEEEEEEYEEEEEEA